MKKIGLLLTSFTLLFSASSAQCSWYDIFLKRDYIIGSLWRGESIPEKEIKKLGILLKGEVDFENQNPDESTEEALLSLYTTLSAKVMSFSDDEKRQKEKQENFDTFVKNLFEHSDHNSSFVLQVFELLEPHL